MVRSIKVHLLFVLPETFLVIFVNHVDELFVLTQSEYYPLKKKGAKAPLIFMCYNFLQSKRLFC